MLRRSNDGTLEENIDGLRLVVLFPLEERHSSIPKAFCSLTRIILSRPPPDLVDSYWSSPQLYVVDGLVRDGDTP